MTNQSGSKRHYVSSASTKVGKVVKTAKKRKTRRAVNARRTLDQREAIALQKLDHWLDVLERATSKVKLYRRELTQVRTLKAGKVAEEIFGRDASLDTHSLEGLE